MFGKVVVGGALWWAVWGASTCMWGSLSSTSMLCSVLLGLSFCWSIGFVGVLCVCLCVRFHVVSSTVKVGSVVGLRLSVVVW